MASTSTTSINPQAVDLEGESTMNRPTFHFPFFKFLVYILVTLGALVFVMPFLWMVSTSLMRQGEVVRGQFIPGSDLLNVDSVSDTDLERPMGDFLYATADFGFRGVKSTVVYDTSPNGGAFDLYIDDQFIETIDTFSNEPTIGNEYVIDSYPTVRGLTSEQAVSLPNGNHTITIIYNNEVSQGDQLVVREFIVENVNGELETITTGTDDFEIDKGFWEPFIAVDGDLVAISYDEEEEVYRHDGEVIEPEQVIRRSTNLGFPSYFEERFDQVDRSGAIQALNHADFISRRLTTGGYALYSPPFTDQTYIITGTVSNYFKVWKDGNFEEYFVNSIIIAFLSVTGQTLFAILAAYAFAKMQFPGKNVLFGLFLLTIFIPVMATLVPNLITVTRISEWSVDQQANINEFLGFTLLEPESVAWIDNWIGLVVPFLASTFSIFLLRQFFMQIPDELWDAAQIDGAGHVVYLFRVVVPVSRAAITTVVLFSFIGTWDALEWPILITTSEEWRPIAYGLYEFQGNEGSNPQLVMAGAMIALFPIMVIYFIAQKQFTEGIATTGLKG